MTQLASASVSAATSLTSLLKLRRLSYMSVLKKETGMQHASSDWVTQMIPRMPSTSIALKSVVASSSPFILNATLNKHLNQYNDPVAKDVKKNIYVEDLISGVQHEEEAATYYTRARTLMSPVDFNLRSRSWTSNNPVIQSLAAKGIPPLWPPWNLSPRSTMEHNNRHDQLPAQIHSFDNSKSNQ